MFQTVEQVVLLNKMDIRRDYESEPVAWHDRDESIKRSESQFSRSDSKQTSLRTPVRFSALDEKSSTVEFSPSKIAQTVCVVGTGDYGRALCKRLLCNGFDVVCGSRMPKARSLVKVDRELGSVKLIAIDEAVMESNVVLLAIPFEYHYDTLMPLRQLLDGKILVDISNPVSVSKGSSIAEQLALLLPESKVVKAFNTVSAYAMEHTHAVGGNEVFICGDDVGARTTVQQLASEMGFKPIDKGGLRSARDLEKIPLMLMPGWGLPTIVVGLVFSLWFAYDVWNVHKNSGNAWDHLPMYTMNKVFGDTAINLLAICYLAGCVAAIFQLSRCTKFRRFPNWLDRWLKMRKQLGLWSLSFATMHCILSLAIVNAAYYPYYYDEVYYGVIKVPPHANSTLQFPIDLKMAWWGETLILLGVLALVLMAIVGITSLPSVGAAMNWREWNFIQSQLGSLCLLVAIAHVILRGFKYWMAYTPDKVILHSALLASLLPWLTMLLKILLKMPCLCIPLNKIRRGWEPKCCGQNYDNEVLHSDDALIASNNYHVTIITNS